MTCGSCGTEAAPDARFCSHCGTRLALAPASTASAADLDLGAERRLLTVMFCDIVGSTSLSESLDPEDLRDILEAYYGICSDAIEHFDGHVAKYLGDGALVYFGYPNAHEDDARRAVMAGLEIAAAMPDLRTLLPADSPAPQVRVGVHTGLTVVGEVGAGSTREALVLGDTPNLAARLQQLAEPNDVIVSGATHGLIRDHFEFDDLGTIPLRGISRPVAAWRVAGRRTRPRLAFGRVPMIGRDTEIELIAENFAAARAGSERFVWIEGEAGMGKSRLVDTIRTRLDTVDHLWLSAPCSTFHRNTYLYPLIQLIQTASGITESDTVEQRAERLKALLMPAGLSAEAWSLVAQLMGTEPVGGGSLDLSPQQRRRRTLEAIAGWLRGLSADVPVVLAVEDLHWADHSTLELLGLIAEHPQNARLLGLLTFRPMPREWCPTAPAAHVRLGPLDAAQIASLVATLAAGKRMPAADLRGIVERTDGVPFFVEELARTVLEAQATRTADDPSRADFATPIPLTLRGSLLAQLDRLGPARRIAQFASMLGRRFPVDLLEAVVADATGLDTAVDELVRGEVLVRSVTTGRQYLEFRHALIQETAYDSLLRSVRRRMHGEIARVIEDRYPAEAQAVPEIVGHHWAVSGEHGNAAPYLRLAADRSAGVYANEEAVVLYRQTITSLEAVLVSRPEEAAVWTGQLLEVTERLGDILALVRRKAEAERAYRTALDRARDSVHVSRLYRKIGFVYDQDQARGHDGLDLAERALGDDADDRSPDWRREWISIQLARLRMHYWYDELDQMLALIRRIEPYIDAHATLDQRAEFFNQLTLTNFRRERYLVSADTLAYATEYVASSAATGDIALLAAARFTYGFALTFGGRPEDAIEELLAALELTRRCGDRTVEIRCLAYLATACRLRDRVEMAAEFAAACLDSATAESMVEYVGMAESHLAWVAWRQNDRELAAQRVASALAAWQDIGMAWPFQWTGLLPRIAVALEVCDVDTVIECARSLLDPVQQRLPDAVSRPLRDLVAASDDTESVRAHAHNALAAAAEAGLFR